MTTSCNNNIICKDKLPIELHSCSTWLNWKIFDTRGGKHVAPYKAPIAPNSLKQSSYNDPSNWLDLDGAIARVLSGEGVQLGISLTPDGLCVDNEWLWCLDFDGWSASEGDDDGALELISELGTYTEFSPSETGFKVYFVSDKLPVTVPKIHFSPSKFASKYPDVKKYQDRAIEIFSKGRFLAVTGDWISPKTRLQLKHFDEPTLDALLIKLDQWAKREGGAGIARNTQKPFPLTNRTITDKGCESAYQKLTASGLKDVLERINHKDEQTWFEVACSLARVYGENGREVFIAWSHDGFGQDIYQAFNRSDVNNTFDRALRASNTHKTGYGCKRLCDLAGISTVNADWEFVIDPKAQAEFDAILDATQFSPLNALQSGAQISFPEVGKNNKPMQMMVNLQAVMNQKGITARYNQISKRSEIFIPGLSCVSDEASNTALTHVTDQAIKSGMSASRIPEMVDAIASQNPYCPVQAYIESVRWDGVSRFNQFTEQIVSGNKELTNVFMRKWLIQAVSAAYEPNGITNAGVIVLTGAQGIGKTRLFSDLTSGISGVFLEGQTLNPADKDSVMSAVSHWIVELGELESTFRKADLAQLKAFITRQHDTLRRPYARKDSMFPRRTVFAGTVNDYHFLHDPTGNRRFWPIDAQAINRDITINYQQLWAEVKSWYDMGERGYLTNSESDLLRQYSETFLVTDPNVEALLVKYPFTGCTKWKKQNMKEICMAIGVEKPTTSQLMRIAGAIFKYNGGQKSINSNGVKYHFVPDRSHIEDISRCEQQSISVDSYVTVVPVVPEVQTSLAVWE